MNDATLRIPKVLRWCLFAVLSTIFSLPPVAVADDSVSVQGQVSQATAQWFSLQIGAYRRLSLAEKTVSILREKGIDAFLRYEDTGGRGKWYRVYAGRYATRKEAREVAITLVRQDVVDAYILREIYTGREALNAGDTQLREEPTMAARQVGKDTGDPNRTSSDSLPPAPKQPVQSIDPSVLPGSTLTTVELSLIDAIRYSLEGNREISIVSYGPKQAQTQIEGAESAYDPLVFADSTLRRDPNLDSSVTDIVTEDEFSARAGIRKPLKTGGSLSTYLESRRSDLNNTGLQRTYKHVVAPTIELKQPLLNNIGSKQEQAAIKIANYQATISDEEFRRKAVEVTNQVAHVYWKLYLSEELVRINRRNLDLAEEVYRREAERFARGISLRLDMARAKSNAQVRHSTWLKSKEAYGLTMDRLKLLLNWGSLNIDSDVRIVLSERPKTAHIEVNEDQIIERALSNRPEIIKARQELMIREVDQNLAAHQRLPNLDFVGRYSVSGYGDEFDDAREDVSMGDDDAWEVGLQFEWALGNRLAKSREKRKTLDRQQAVAQLRRIEDDIKLDVKQVLHRLSTLKGEIESNGLAKTAAGKVVDGEFIRFDIGQTSNEELLRAQDLLAVTSRSFVRAIVDFNSAILDLARAQGDLPGGVVIEENN